MNEPGEVGVRLNPLYGPECPHGSSFLDLSLLDKPLLTCVLTKVTGVHLPPGPAAVPKAGTRRRERPLGSERLTLPLALGHR